MGGCRLNPKLVVITTNVNWSYSPELQVLGEETVCMTETDLTLEIWDEAGETADCGTYKTL
jgi:hypothetical protein